MKKNIIATLIITSTALCIGFFAGRQTQAAEIPELSVMTGNYYDYKVVETVDGNTWMIDQEYHDGELVQISLDTRGTESAADDTVIAVRSIDGRYAE
mgnify:CR=1 FL=1